MKKNNNYIFTSIYINKSTNTFLLENKVCYFYKISGNNNINNNNGNNNNNANFLNINTKSIFGVMKEKEKDKNDDKLKNKLKLILKFYRLEQNIKSIIESRHQKEENYFLLSENWLKDFKNIFKYNEILIREVINKISENENSHTRDIVHKILNDIPEHIKIHLRNLEGTNIINDKLCNQNLYKINKNQDYGNYIDKSLFSYALINEKIIKCFEENNINIKKDDLEIIKCLFLDNKLFIKIKKNEEQRTLNIGYYKDNLFIPDLIINSNRKNINNILDHFKSKGYNKYIQYLLFENEVNECDGIKMININKDVDAFFCNKQLVSGKLKAFIFLNVCCNDIVEKTKNSNKKESEEVYLVNLQWLNAFGYSRVNEIIKKNINNQFIKNKNFDDNELFNEFILSLEHKEIKDLEKDLKENSLNLIIFIQNLYI